MQAYQPLVVQMNQQPTGGGAKQGVGVRDDGNPHLGSAWEDFAVEVGTQLPKGAAAARLLATVPGQDG